jgi:hypothetical protein
LNEAKVRMVDMLELLNAGIRKYGFKMNFTKTRQLETFLREHTLLALFSDAVRPFINHSTNYFSLLK